MSWECNCTNSSLQKRLHFHFFINMDRDAQCWSPKTSGAHRTSGNPFDLVLLRC